MKVAEPARSTLSDNARRADLRRMRAMATGLLALMAAVFLAARLAPAAWTWTGYVAAFAEAGMVGGCADWFAVTALFRRPLGLPIPHTGIIPRNKDRIGEALGDFIANNFLTAGVLDARLSSLDPARRLAEWLGEGDRAEALGARLAVLLPDMADAGGELRALAGGVIRRAIQSRPLAPLAGKALGWLWRDPGVQRLFSRAADALAHYLEDQESFIQSQVTVASWRWMPKWLDRILAERFADGLVGAAHGLGDPDHPWRAALGEAVEDLIERLGTDPDLLERGEALKARWLADPELPTRLEGLWAEVGQRLGAEAGGRDDALGEILARALRALGRWLEGDDDARERLNRWVRIAARRVLSSQRHAIGGFVAQVVAGWDAAEVADRLELQVGRDLQYIRINGALVGGLVGLVIFTASRWLS